MIRELCWKCALVVVISSAITTMVTAGPFPAFDEHGILAESVADWADDLVDYAPAPGVVDTPGWEGGDPIPNDDPLRALGPSDGATVSLGDLDAVQQESGVAAGEITVAFDRPLFDGPGPDLAVFENAGAFFGGPFVFAELGFVEVSSNGRDFARFEAISLNEPPLVNPEFDPELPESIPDNTPFLAVPHERETLALDALFGFSFAGLNTTNVFQLAGTHPAGIGTPFDLATLADHALVASGQLDLDAVRYVRIEDIPGNGSVVDSQQHPIYDGWLTTVSGGIDIDAVGAIHIVPEPLTGALILTWAVFAARARYQRASLR